MAERAYPSTSHDWLDFSQRLYRAAYVAQRARRGRWAKNIARAAEMAADKAEQISLGSIPPNPRQATPAEPSPSNTQGSAGTPSEAKEGR